MNERDFDYDTKFVECYEELSPQLRNYIHKNINNWHIAEEILQDLFVNLYARGVPLDLSVTTTKGFLYKSARNKIIDFFKKKRRFTNHSSHTLEEIKLDDSIFQSLEDSFLEGQVISTLHDTLNLLTDAEQEIIYSRMYEKESIKVLSERLEISTYKINKILKKIRFRIKDSLAKYFSDE